MEQNKKKCPYCGEEIMADAKKCRHCGEWLDKPASSKTTVKTKGKKKMWIYTAIAILIVIGIGVLIAALLSNDAKDNVSNPTAEVAEDYTIQEVSFDPKSLVALNLMTRDSAISMLRSNGWESALESKIQAYTAQGEPTDFKYADGFIKNFDESKVIWAYLTDLPEAATHGEGIIEFETTSDETFEKFETYLTKNMGYGLYYKGGDEYEEDGIHYKLQNFRYEKGDTINSPLIGLEFLRVFEGNDTIPSMTRRILYLQKIPKALRK